MASLRDIVAYILKMYPEQMRDELSNARVTKMVYLADWHSCLRDKGQLSNIKWYFDNYGPFVHDVLREAEINSDIFAVETTTNAYGSPKKLIVLKRHDFEPRLTESEKKSLDHVIEKSSNLFWSDFIKLVYSTFPVASSERYTFLNLPSLAKSYKAQRDARV